MRRLEYLGEILLPSAEKDEGFRQEVLSLSHGGLRIYALATLGGALFVLLVYLLVISDILLLLDAVVLTCVGLALLALVKWSPTYPYSRALAVSAAVVCGCLVIGTMMLLAKQEPRIEDFVPLQAAFVVLSLVAAVPVLPVQAFGVTAVLTAFYLLWPTRMMVVELMFLATLAVLAAALASVLYRQRCASYQAFLGAIRATSDVREVQARLMMSEHTATLGRLSAALSHELNSPVGVLQSSVDTLVLLSARQAAGGGDPERLVRLQSDLRKSIQDSARRLREIVGRIQRFSNLDRAEVQESDLNEIIRDVVALAESELERPGWFRLDLLPLTPLTCRPAHVSAALHTLISNAGAAVQVQGQVEIQSRESDGTREIIIADQGTGIPKGDLPFLFDPSFKQDGGQIRAGNWSMFGARQIIREHGGEIDVHSQEGRGTRIRVKLPV